MATEEDFEPEIPSDDEIAIILNVHLPQEGQRFDPIPKRPPIFDQFRPTNPTWLRSLRFVPPNLDADTEPKPWRDYPTTMNEYFNYGFTEMVWEAYKFKQQELRKMFPDKEDRGSHRHGSKKDRDRHRDRDRERDRDRDRDRDRERDRHGERDRDRRSRD